MSDPFFLVPVEGLHLGQKGVIMRQNLTDLTVADRDLYLSDKLCCLAFRQEEYHGAAVGIAKTFDELAAAYQLVYREYLTRGFCHPNESGMYYTFYCFLPRSRTFVFEKDRKVLGTLSLITDTQCGLPAEAAFRDEINALRAPERCLAEISLLAFDRSLYEGEDRHLANFRKLATAFFLFKGMFDYVRSTSITDFVIAVHPKQERLYRSFTFQKIGSPRPYRPACGNPAIAMHANIQRWHEIVPQDQGSKVYLLRETSKHGFENDFEWNTILIRNLLQYNNISRTAKKHLQSHYPGL
ncbi:MAG: hypothetical protein NC930_04910 [Candidatus Omnitrophica bacterium]|nr:hypothetical protein [Candidatus Omnitrophota bacterium]